MGHKKDRFCHCLTLGLLEYFASVFGVEKAIILIFLLVHKEVFVVIMMMMMLKTGLEKFYNRADDYYSRTV